MIFVGNKWQVRYDEFYSIKKMGKKEKAWKTNNLEFLADKSAVGLWKRMPKVVHMSKHYLQPYCFFFLHQCWLIANSWEQSIFLAKKQNLQNKKNSVQKERVTFFFLSMNVNFCLLISCSFFNSEWILLSQEEKNYFQIY